MNSSLDIPAVPARPNASQLDPIAIGAATFSRSAAFPTSILNALAILLEYPGPEFMEHCQHAQSFFHRANDSFNHYQKAMTALPAQQREELYTATFDLSPACVPYASVHLFGAENFKRGELMAALNQRLRESAVDRRGELPDHISVLLQLAASLDERERSELAEFILLGSLRKMIEALDNTNPYRFLLCAVREVLEGLHPAVRPAVVPVDQTNHCASGHGCVGGSCGDWNENP